MRRNLLPLIAFGVGTLLNTACAPRSSLYQPPNAKTIKSIDEVMSILNVRDPEMIENDLPGNYTVSRYDLVAAKTLAGLYAGTVKASITPDNRFSLKGYYSQALHPDALENVLRDADTNHDKIVTGKELEQLERQIYEKIRSTYQK